VKGSIDSRQVAIIAGAAVIAALFLALGMGLLNPGPAELDERELTDLPQVETQPYELETNIIPVQEGLDFGGSGDYSQDEIQNITVYESLNPGVVNITTEIVGYNWFLEPVPQRGGSGSGSIIDRRGYVLTNYHVVENAVRVNLTLADESNYQGEVVGYDRENDLAVIKFDPQGKELVTIPFGDSDGLRVGQKVLAIGNPFGLERTLTTGIVSALGRPVKTDGGLVIQEMIQTESSINPGNSGGPLLNSRGQMIGVNTMVYSPSGGSVGIGFAVPVNTARRIVPDLIEYGFVKRGWIDVVPVQLFPSLVRYANLPVREGLLVSRVINGGNAQSAGIRGGQRNRAVRSRGSVIYLGGDIIVGVNGMSIATLADLYSALESSIPGEKAIIEVVRGNDRLQLTLTLSERPEQYQWE
jgi:S1-C subfamily serine protease